MVELKDKDSVLKQIRLNCNSSEEEIKSLSNILKWKLPGELVSKRDTKGNVLFRIMSITKFQSKSITFAAVVKKINHVNISIHFILIAIPL